LNDSIFSALRAIHHVSDFWFDSKEAWMHAVVRRIPGRNQFQSEGTCRHVVPAVSVNLSEQPPGFRLPIPTVRISVPRNHKPLGELIRKTRFQNFATNSGETCSFMTELHWVRQQSALWKTIQ